MNFSLFSLGPIAFLCVVCSVVTYQLAQRLLGEKKDNWKKYSTYLSLAILLISLVFMVSFKFAFPSDKLPPNLFLMNLTFATGLALLIIALYLKKYKLTYLGLASTLLGLAISLLLLNSYYHYYPSFGSLMGNRYRIATDLQQTSTTYDANGTKSLKNPTSVEDQLYKNETQTNGTVSIFNIPGINSKFNTRNSYLYSPAITKNGDNINLPVIVLMAGSPGNPVDWLNGGGLVKTLDQFAKEHHGITPYVFVVDNIGSQNNDTECVNSPRGNVETYLSEDVPNYIKDHFSVSKDPSHWAIGGLSLGGLCGIMTTLRHPDKYNYFLDFGGEIGPEVGSKAQTIKTLFNGSKDAWQEHQPLWLINKNKNKNLGGYFTVGKSDSRAQVNSIKELSQKSRAAGIENTLQLIGGDHTFNVWEESFRDALPWISNRIGATVCISNCP